MNPPGGRLNHIAFDYGNTLRPGLVRGTGSTLVVPAVGRDDTAPSGLGGRGSTFRLHTYFDAIFTGGAMPLRFRPGRRRADLRAVKLAETGPIPVEFGGYGCSRPFTF